MLVCRIEMWHGGSEARKREIGRAEIVNVGGNQDVGQYEVRLRKSPEYARSPGVWRRGRVSNFWRKKLGPYDLLLRALIACIADRSSMQVSQAGPDPKLDGEVIEGL